MDSKHIPILDEALKSEKGEKLVSVIRSCYSDEGLKEVLIYKVLGMCENDPLFMERLSQQLKNITTNIRKFKTEWMDERLGETYAIWKESRESIESLPKLPLDHLPIEFQYPRTLSEYKSYDWVLAEMSVAFDIEIDTIKKAITRYRSKTSET